MLTIYTHHDKWNGWRSVERGRGECGCNVNRNVIGTDGGGRCGVLLSDGEWLPGESDAAYENIADNGVWFAGGT